MSSDFKKGDLVQSIHGGPVMRVLDVRMSERGETIVDAALVHGAASEPAQYAPSALKIIGIDQGDDDDDSDEDDHDP
jgi:uncharacterized protein YodC (DUF2158 family)